MTKLSIICQIILINSVFLDVLAVNDDCPSGKYLCKNTVNRCVDMIAICDGKKDCPDGEDETTSYCKGMALTKQYQNYNPGKAYLNEGAGYLKLPKEQVNNHVQTKNTENNEQGDQGGFGWNNGCSAGNYARINRNSLKLSINMLI